MRANMRIKNVIRFLFLMCVLSLSCSAMPQHNLLKEQSPAIFLQYELIDLGTTDLPEKSLTRQQNQNFLGPLINNAGDIVGNSSQGGFIQKQGQAPYQPTLQKAKFYFHAINNLSDILVSLERQPFEVEWYLWPTADGWQSPRIKIDTVELSGHDVLLTHVNDSKTITGTAEPFLRFMPLTWSLQNGLYRLGHFKGLEITGKALDLNQNGYIAGKTFKNLESFPFVWDGNKIYDLFNLRNSFRIPENTKLVFEEILLGHDNVLYGTYWLNKEFMQTKERQETALLTFAFNPKNQELQLFDLNGMRFSSINSKDRSVGSVNGKAAFADIKDRLNPTLLEDIIDESQKKGWQLLEATDINDNSMIVGYGKKEDGMHLFLAKPLHFNP